MSQESEQLRATLGQRAATYATAGGFTTVTTQSGVAIFEEEAPGQRHGNFIDASYQAISSTPQWQKRLLKSHPQAAQVQRPSGKPVCELDSCNSSDALTMNIFCHPGLLQDHHVAALFGRSTLPLPEFGFKARLPRANRSDDASEIDLRFHDDAGTILCEAKLTEGDFTTQDAQIVHAYLHFGDLFQTRHLLDPTGTRYENYQLIRNILAAYRYGADFYLLHDDRRPDLAARFDKVVQAIKLPALKKRCHRLTWQQIVAALPDDSPLRSFLTAKYGM